MNVKKRLTSENQSNKAPLSLEAALMHSQSLSLLNSIEDCQLEGFQTVELAVPQMFDHQGSLSSSFVTETDFFSLAKQLFEQQMPLFPPESIAQSELDESLAKELELAQLANMDQQNMANITSPVSGGNQQVAAQKNVPEQPVNHDEGLDAINNLLNSG